MGQASSKNVQLRSESSITSSEDDEPGGIGGPPSRYQRKHVGATIIPPRGQMPEPDILDAEIMAYAQSSNPHSPPPYQQMASPSPSRGDGIASVLDTILGKKSVNAISTSPAMGQMAVRGSAKSSLKGAKEPQHLDIPLLVVQDEHGQDTTHISEYSPGASGSLTSASTESSSTSPDTSDDDVRSHGSSAGPGIKTGLPGRQGLPLNRMIKRICVSGIQARKEFCLSFIEIKAVCETVSELFLSQPVMLELVGPVKVVGDTHGQFKDLMRIFKQNGMPPHTNYLFLGDYVDRGKQSLETIMLLLCLKLRYPNNVFLLRGNHESANVTKVYGFYDECKRRSSLKTWRSIVDVFNCLPIAATIGGRIFCVHGGLSPCLNDLKQIEQVVRPTDVPDSGLVSDLLWSDPDPATSEWADNDRGVSYCFGQRVLHNFCQRFRFDLVARGHMVVEDGYEFFGDRKLVTIFSAPNYCGEFDNWGAVMSVDENLLCSFELLEPSRRPKNRSKLKV